MARCFHDAARSAFFMVLTLRIAACIEVRERRRGARRKVSVFGESELSLIHATIITSAEREVKDSRRSGMYQSYHFLTRLGMQSL